MIIITVCITIQSLSLLNKVPLEKKSIWLISARFTESRGYRVSFLPDLSAKYAKTAVLKIK